MSESFSQAPYSTVLPAYAYAQYATFEDIQAFYGSLNGVQQGYLNWFFQVPLSLYTNAALSGALLDWCATGIYGIVRPVLVTTATTANGPLGTNILGTHPLATLSTINSGSAGAVNDDIYKRVMTWIIYRGDGQKFTMPWLLRRVERFLGGPNGTDVALNFSNRPRVTVSGKAFTISVPSANPVSATFQALMAQGFLPTPLPYTFTVDLV